MSVDGGQLASGALSLRPCAGEDLLDLYRPVWPMRHHWWRVFGLGLPNPHQFISVVEYDTEIIFAIERDDVVIGVCSLFDVDRASGYGWIDRVVLPGHDSPVLRQKALHTLVDHVFTNWDLRKVYAAHHGFEPAFFEGAAFRWEVEGVLPRSYWALGRRWDRTVSAVWRRDWVVTRSPVSPGGEATC